MDAWKHLAQAKHGADLIQQIGKAFASTGDWPLLALAQRQGQQVRLLAASLHGSPLPPLEYSLSQAPCAALYPHSTPPHTFSNTLIYSSRPEQFIHWPLVKHFIWQTYFAHRIEVPSTLGQFHLLALAKDPYSKLDLPKELLLTSCERLAASIIQQAEHTELQTLRQIQQAQPAAFARLCPLGHLHQLSGGLAQLLKHTLQSEQPLPFADIATLMPQENLPYLLSQQQSSSHYCTVRQADGKLIEQVLTLTPISSELGFIATFSDPALTRSDTVIAQYQQAQQTQLLHQRIEQELARIRRNNQVAALFFIEPVGKELPPEHWQALQQDLNALFRQEDLIVQPSGQQLAVLSACFDNQGQAPLQQMNAMAHKLAAQLRRYQPSQHWQIKTRLLTQWDQRLDTVLDANLATLWQSHPR